MDSSPSKHRPPDHQTLPLRSAPTAHTSKQIAQHRTGDSEVASVSHNAHCRRAPATPLWADRSWSATSRRPASEERRVGGSRETRFVVTWQHDHQGRALLLVSWRRRSALLSARYASAWTTSIDTGAATSGRRALRASPDAVGLQEELAQDRRVALGLLVRADVGAVLEQLPLRVRHLLE